MTTDRADDIFVFHRIEPGESNRRVITKLAAVTRLNKKRSLDCLLSNSSSTGSSTAAWGEGNTADNATACLGSARSGWPSVMRFLTDEADARSPGPSNHGSEHPAASSRLSAWTRDFRGHADGARNRYAPQARVVMESRSSMRSAVIGPACNTTGRAAAAFVITRTFWPSEFWQAT
jgi:hypothetical protein